MLLREIEVRSTIVVGFQPRTISFVLGQARKRNQSECDIVSSLMRHPITEQIASAFRNDGEPALGVGFEQMPFERVELISNEDGNSHEPLLFETA